MMPLKWAAGDPCVVRKQLGVVDSVDVECATVQVGERLLFVALDELKLRPFPSTPAGKVAFVTDLASEHVDDEGTIIPPILTAGEVRDALDAIDGKPARKSRSPVLDASVATLRELVTEAHERRWSPKLLRKAIRSARKVSRSTWQKAIQKVFGSGVRALRDLRQLGLFDGGGAFRRLFCGGR